jgi:hypothetical protein
MARVVICDYLKTTLKKGDKTYVLTVDGSKFEIGEEARRQLIQRLEADEVPAAVMVQTETRQAELAAQVAPTVINTESHQPGPASMPQPPQASQEPLEDGTPIQIELPENPTQRLPAPSRITYERVMREATIRPEGTLPSLTDPASRKEAAKKLREIEAEKQKELRGLGGSEVNVTDPEDRRGRGRDY